MRNQVLPGRESYAKDAIKFYYKLAKINGLTNALLEAAGLRNEDSLRWSYNKGRISIEQINAYNHVLGVDKKYLIGEEELSEEIKSKEMERLKSRKKGKSTNSRSGGEDSKIVELSDIVSIYKNKIMNCESSACRNQVKEELATFKKEMDENIEHLTNLIETMNIIDEKSGGGKNE